MTTAPFEPDPTDPDIDPSTEPRPSEGPDIVPSSPPIDPIAPGEDPGAPVPEPGFDPTES